MWNACEQCAKYCNLCTKELNKPKRNLTILMFPLECILFFVDFESYCIIPLIAQKQELCFVQMISSCGHNVGKWSIIQAAPINILWLSNVVCHFENIESWSFHLTSQFPYLRWGFRRLAAGCFIIMLHCLVLFHC